MVVMETAGLDATELGGSCRQRSLFPEQVDRWRQAATDASAKPVLPMAEQKDLEKPRQPAGPAGNQAAAAGTAPQGQGWRRRLRC